MLEVAATAEVAGVILKQGSRGRRRPGARRSEAHGRSLVLLDVSIGRSPSIKLTLRSEVDERRTTLHSYRCVASPGRAARGMHFVGAMDDHRMMTAPAFLEIMTGWHPGLASVDDGLTARPTREERRPSRERLWAVRELIGALDETAVLGRDQLMRQVLEVFQADVLRPTLRLSKRQLDTVTTTLAELAHEATRAALDVGLFCQRAQLVVDILLLG